MKKQFTKIALAATLALALAFTFSCKEKSSSKAEDNQKPAAETAVELAKAEEAATKEAASCKGGGKGGDKLLECLITGVNNVLQKFEYDEQNRIIKTYTLYDTTTITYSTDDLVTVETIFSDNSKSVKQNLVINGNTITVESETLTVNKDGYIAKQENEYWNYTYQYKGGNLIREDGVCIDDSSENYSIDYKYDNKKSPFSNSKTPKWLLQHLFGSDEKHNYANKNNAIRYDRDAYRPLGANYEYEYDSEGFPTKETIETQIDDRGETITTHYIYRGGTTMR